MQLKNEDRIFELILSIGVDKWMEGLVTIDSIIPGGKKIPISCDININGVILILRIVVGEEALIVAGTTYRGGEEICKLAEAIRDRIYNLQYAYGDKILHNLLEARKNHII